LYNNMERKRSSPRTKKRKGGGSLDTKKESKKA